MTIIYPTIEQAVEIHKNTVKISGGGIIGQLETGKLVGVLNNIQNDDYYPTFEYKLSHLFFCICNFHCFSDGNKRLSIALCTYFLIINGYLYCGDSFIREMENISYHVASGKINKELLHEIITAILNKDMDDESLKLKIYHAISEDN
ncbi:MAG: Fic family protein [Desulfamplus sp.]|nr:Fic family protein [Desulfamplus sp.]